MAGRRQAAPCGKDCFNCEFPECIYDRLDAEDYKQSDERDRLLTQTPQQKKLAAQQRAYREANREKVAAQQRAYREANREKLAAQRRAYREANREKLAAQQRAYREANREKLAARRKNQSQAAERESA